MKNKVYVKKIIISSIFLVLILLVANTYTFTNLWVLLTDSSNYIPSESNIINFRPTQIDSGSGGYWRYGEDNDNYYYFSVKEENVYMYTLKDQNCEGFDEFNYLTWCKKHKAHHIKN